MLDDYYKRLMYTTVSENYKVIVELAVAIAAHEDANIEKELDKVIASLRKSNAALTRLAKKKNISLRKVGTRNLDY